MTVISSKEFVANQKRYFDMAINEDVCIKNGENIFRVCIVNNRKTKYKQPDEDFYRGISKDELLNGIYEDINVFFENK